MKHKQMKMFVALAALIGSQIALAANEPDVYLEYVESTGGQYIDTGVVGKAGVKAEIDIDWISGTSPLGVRGGGNFLLLQNLGSLGYGGQALSSGETKTYVALNTGRHFVVSEAAVGGKFSITVDGVTSNSANTISADATTSLNIYVFAVNHNGGAGWLSSAKLYGLKLYDNGELVRNFVPGKKAGVAGLYDKVNDVWYVSQSDTPLVAGPELAANASGCTFVDYVESNGSQYIDTGVEGRAGTKAVIDLDWTANQGILGVYKKSSEHFMMLQGSSSTIKGQASSGGSINTGVKVDTGRHLVVSEVPADGKMSIQVDGGTVQKSANTIAADFTTVSNISVFAHVRTDGSGVYSPANMKLYGLKLYQQFGSGGYRLMRNFKPCVLNDVAGLYDTVSGGFFSSRQDPLIAGPAVDRGAPDAFVEYVESNSSQWIDTGVIGRAGVKSEIDFDWTSGQGVLGVYVRSDNHFMLIQNATDIKGQVSGSGTVSTGVKCNTGRHTVVSEAPKGEKMTMSVDSATAVSSETAIAEDFTTGVGIGVFAHLRADGTVYSPANMKLYGLKLYMDGVLQRDYRPCVKGGVAGLYDAVSGVIFYPTNATGLTASTTQLPVAIWRDETGDGSLDDAANWCGAANATTNIVHLRGTGELMAASAHSFGNLSIEGCGAVAITGEGVITVGDTLKSFTDVTAANLVLNGTECSTNLTITGSIAGHGTIPSLTLGDGAVFKPDGADYLSVTDALSGTVRIDASGLDMSSFSGRVPLFKTATAEILPSIVDVVFAEGGCPRGWSILTSDADIGYYLSRLGLIISFH